MKDKAASRRYAQGFLDSCREDIGIKQAFDELVKLKQIIGENPELEKFLRNPEINFLDKETFIKRVFQNDFSLQSLNFLEFIIKKGRITQIAQIADCVKVIYQREIGAEKVLLNTAFALDEKILVGLKAKLEQGLQKKLELEVGITPDLIGGIQVVVGNIVIDASVKKNISDLRENLLKIKVG